MAIRFSFIVPFRRGLHDLAQVLDALEDRPRDSELIVAADGAEEDCRALVQQHGGRVVGKTTAAGPAAARNLAAAAASGDVLVFVDADVVVSREALGRLATLFEQTDLTAAFGAYDVAPACPDFFSQYKNLSHAYVHRVAAGPAQTFWAGFGAVRRRAFLDVGGFDERFRRPSVEDIDLGYRLTRGGYHIVLDPALSARHLKRWTLTSVVLTDMRDRGIPWTQLVLRYGAFTGHLNVGAGHRWSTLVACAAVVVALTGPGVILRLVALGLCALALVVLNRDYYRFMWRLRGGGFAARVFAMHSLQHVYNAVSGVVGLALFAARRAHLRLPGALDPADGRTCRQGLWDNGRPV